VVIGAVRMWKDSSENRFNELIAATKRKSHKRTINDNEGQGEP